jgi:hypothetical protein
MAVAADPDPYFALPRLYGAPAYARPPRIVPETERPLNPDDLPIVADQTNEERAVAETLQASGLHRPGDYPFQDWNGQRPTLAAESGNGDGRGLGARRFSLRALTHRIGPRDR